MPVQPTYPGVYIEEIPSGGFTVTGVATAITAFVGRTAAGPTDEPTACFSFGDFENLFGGRHFDYPLSYAVEDFFLNGGAEALIVRVDSATKPSATAAATVGNLKITASSAGSWGNGITLTANTTGLTDAVAARYGLQLSDLFNLVVTYNGPNKKVVTEAYTALTTKNKPNRIDRVLTQQSALLDCNWPTDPAATVDQAALAAMKAEALTGGTDGAVLVDTDILGDESAHTGLFALEKADLFNLLCIPWDQRGTDIDTSVHAAAAAFCARRRAIYIVDAPETWTSKVKQGKITDILPTDLGINDEASQRNSAVYFPKVVKPDLEMGGVVDTFPACGIIAGQYATTDANRGVWKAPAGIATGLAGITGLTVNLNDPQNGVLNPLGINCLRDFRVLGPIIWGARTLRGADLMSDDFKYLPVRRLTLYIEESLFRGTKFAVFEPNDETLWSQLRLAVGGFMADLARQGAFYGYSVACDKTTTTQSDIDHGVVNVRVAFAPVKPAEFVVLEIQQMAGQVAS